MMKMLKSVSFVMVSFTIFTPFHLYGILPISFQTRTISRNKINMHSNKIYTNKKRYLGRRIKSKPKFVSSHFLTKSL